LLCVEYLNYGDCIVKGFSGKHYEIKKGDVVIHPDFYGHKNIEFIVSSYDIACGEIVRNNGAGGKALNLDVCTIRNT